MGLPRVHPLAGVVVAVAACAGLYAWLSSPGPERGRRGAAARAAEDGASRGGRGGGDGDDGWRAGRGGAGDRARGRSDRAGRGGGERVADTDRPGGHRAGGAYPEGGAEEAASDLGPGADERGGGPGLPPFAADGGDGPPGRLAGRVLATGGSALAGAHVSRTRAGPGDEALAPEASALTDADGLYRLDDVPPGHWRLTAEADGHAVVSRYVQVLPGGERRADFTLEPGAALEGRCVWADGGAPAADARVTVRVNRAGQRDSWEWRGRAGGDGAFRVPGVPRGEFSVLAISPDDTARGLGRGLDAATAGVLVVRLQAASTLEGRVTDAATGRPVPGAALEAYATGAGFVPSAGRAGPDGRYTLSGLPPDTYELRVRADGYARLTEPGFVVPPGGERLGRDFVLGANPRVSGRVTCRGAAAAGAQVGWRIADHAGEGGGRVDEEFPSATADADGHFVLTLPRAGVLRVLATFAPCARGTSAPRAVSPGAHVDDLELELPAAAAALAGTARFVDGRPARATLRVFDRNVGAATSGAAVGTTTTSDTDNRWAFDALPVGSVEVVAELADGTGRTRAERVTLTEGAGAAAVDFVFPRADVPLAGIVVDPEGTPLSGIDVFAHPEGGGYDVRGTTGADGRFALSVEKPAAYHIRAQRPGRVSADEVRVEAPARALRLVVSAGTRLAGIVTWAPGRAPVTAFDVALAWRRDEGMYWHRTGAANRHFEHERGEFYIDNLPAGVLDVVVTVPGERTRATALARAVRIEGAEVRVELAVARPGRARGRVVDRETREPLADAAVALLLAGMKVEEQSRANPDLAVRAAADGSFVLELPGGVPSTLGVFAPGFLERALSDVTVEAGATVDLGELALVAGNERELYQKDRFGGVGCSLDGRGGPGVAFTGCSPGGPGHRAGILPGDRIQAVDGADARALGLAEVIALVRGRVGTTVALDLLRGDTPVRIVVLREEIVRGAPSPP